MTKLYLAVSATQNIKDLGDVLYDSRYTLISYYYLRKLLHVVDMTRIQNLIVDSGAFTFMNGKKTTKEVLNKFVDEYIEFINTFDIKLFFEMDVDSIFGYEYVLEIREKIEKQTNKKCIPVWHKSRGLQEFINLAKNYDYIAIGGLVTKEIKKNEWRILKKLNKIAKTYKCKVHGLGFTPLENIEQYGFYSVDSSAWTSGHRYKIVFFFDGQRIRSINRKKLKNKRISNYKNLAIQNFNAYFKWQKYLDMRR